MSATATDRQTPMSATATDRQIPMYATADRQFADAPSPMISIQEIEKARARPSKGQGQRATFCATAHSTNSKFESVSPRRRVKKQMGISERPYRIRVCWSAVTKGTVVRPFCFVFCFCFCVRGYSVSVSVSVCLYMEITPHPHRPPPLLRP
jgi:hypothetical protein